MAEEVKGKLLTNGFIPDLKGKKVVIRLVSGGQPVTGTIEATTPMRSFSRRQKGSYWSSNMP